MIHEYGAVILANGILGILMWLVTFIDLVLVGIYLWLLIKKTKHHD